MTNVREFIVVKIRSDHLRVGNDAKELHQREHVEGYSKFDSPNDAFIGGWVKQ